MSSAPTEKAEGKTLEETFRELRTWVDERLIAKGLLSRAPVQTRQEASTVTIAHIEQLKADIATLIKLEGRRNFWSGIAVNAVFFILGLLAGAVSI
jgi:hypothetical protein